MAWDYEMAARLRGLGKRSPYEKAWYRAECTALSPLTFSILDGEIQASGDALVLTRSLSGRRWELGDTVAALLSGGSLLILDRI